jgi:hypothetical protein
LGWVLSHNDYNKTLGQLKNEKNNMIQGDNFSFTPSQKEIYYSLHRIC